MRGGTPPAPETEQMYCHMEMSDGLTAGRIAPCMVQYKIIEGGILEVGTPDKKNVSPFRLTVRFTRVDKPETKTFNPADGGEMGHQCGARWNPEMRHSTREV